MHVFSWKSIIRKMYTYKAVARLRLSEQLITVKIIAHATKEHVISAVTSRNNWRAAGGLCCHTVRHQADSVFAIVHVMPRHPHQQGERRFLLGPLRGHITRLLEMSSFSSVKQSRVDLRVRQLEVSQFRSGAAISVDMTP
jgi:hypothetical protein